MYRDERYASEVDSRVERVDLFKYPDDVAFVVTTQATGEYYGAVSKSFVRRYPEVALPELSWGDSSDPLRLPDGKSVIFTALWIHKEPGPEPYPPRIVYGCTASAIRKAANAGFEAVAMPPIGGDHIRRRKPAMGQAIHDALALLAKRDMEIEVHIALGVPKKRR